MEVTINAYMIIGGSRWGVWRSPSTLIVLPLNIPPQPYNAFPKVQVDNAVVSAYTKLITVDKTHHQLTNPGATNTLVLSARAFGHTLGGS